jgi:cobalt-zinc-cadmium efflux system membrane fusion protein
VLTIAEVLAARCSHGLTIECAECRYEVGVVKVDASLLAPAGSASTSLVQTIRVARQRVATSVRLTGELAVNETAAVHVSPRIPGIIRSVPVDIGARVKPEEVLFTLDSVELGAALGDYEKNLALTALAEKTFRREQDLHAQKAGSGADVIEAQTRHEEIRAALKASEQKLLVLGLSAADIAAIAPADRASLGAPLAVRAPIGGTIIEKHAVRGELVEPGKDVMLLADLDTVWAWGGIYERDLAGVLTRMAAGGVPVAVTVPAFPDHVFTGQLNHISGVMDEATRTVKVRTVIDNRDHRLRPGMFCEVRLLMTSDEEVLAVPKAAVLSDEGVDFVFKHMQGDYYLRQNITRGRTFDDAVEVLAGVEPGITIVTEGAFLLKSDVLRSKMGAGCAD